MLKFTDMLPKMVNHPPFSLEKYIYNVFEQIRKCKTLKVSAWLTASLQLLDNVMAVVMAPKVRIVSYRSIRSVQCLD
jgi:hypothetical protein